MFKVYNATSPTKALVAGVKGIVIDCTPPVIKYPLLCAGAIACGGAACVIGDPNFARGDVMCGSLCCISIGCEAISGVLVWCPIPGKIVTVSALKATSMGCQKFRDLCAADPSSPLC